MIRTLLLCAALAGAGLPAATALAQEAGPAETAVSPDVAALVDAMDLRDVFAVIEAEGMAYGEDLEAEMFPGSGGASWDAAVKDIYDADAALPAFIKVLEAELQAQRADIGPMVEFFNSDLGRRVVTLEVSARRALLDESVEDASKLRLQEMRAERDPRIDALEAFVTANDLVEANVSGGLNASLAFYQGLATAGAFEGGPSEAEILEDVWSQEPQIRADTEEWIYAMLALAYAPLSDAELAEYTAFSETKEGRQLNAALFAGFNAVFTDISRRLGAAAGAFVAGQDI